jgi:hypothetical protein
LLVGTLPAGYGIPWFFLLPSGFVVLVAIHRMLGKPVDEPEPESAPAPELPPV